MNQIEISRQIPVVGSYDVVVCGGGPAGFVAATAAARSGARTALIERFGFLGGMATAGLVSPISVFSYNGKRIIGGIPWEFIESLESIGGAYVETPLNNVAFDPEKYKLAAQRMVLGAGVHLYTNSYLSYCRMEEGRVLEAVIENKSGTQALQGRVFVDCTGDADLAYMAGVPMQPKEGEYQPASMYFSLAGVDTANLPSMHHNRQGVNCHDLAIRDLLIGLDGEERVPEFGGPWFCTLLHEGAVQVNMTRCAVDYLDNRDVARAECRLREDAFRLADVLKRHAPQFKNAYITQVATAIGVRESRRIVGVHTITAEEYLSAQAYPDAVTRSCHPIAVHRAGGAKQDVQFLEKPAYIPYRAMVASGFPNLIVAGRCISADKRAFASIRVQAPCMGMGQAAGTAAAISARNGFSVVHLDSSALRSALAAEGALLED